MFVFITLIMSALATEVNQSSLLLNMMERAHQEVGHAIEAKPELYPHYLVYGLEAEASVGIGDILEAGSSLGVELHYERIEP